MLLIMALLLKQPTGSALFRCTADVRADGYYGQMGV
jgi:hypothetical protein